MRVIVILFLGVAVIALALKFFPASEVPGENTTLAAETKGAVGEGSVDENVSKRETEANKPASRFSRPDDSGSRRAEIEKPLEPPVVIKPLTNRGSGLKAASSLRDIPGLAGALLHRTPSGFRNYLSEANLELTGDRQRLLVAFSLAMAGKATQAVDLAGDLSPGEGVSEMEFEYLKAAVEGTWSRSSKAVVSNSGTVSFAMELALLAREGKRALERREWKFAAKTLSTVLLADVRASWRSDWEFTRNWGELLNAAQEHYRWNKKGSWPSLTEEVLPGDSLSIIRSRVVKRIPGLLLCTGLIDRVNGIGDRYLQAGEDLRIPTELVSTFVDLEARHVFYLFGGELGAVWPVAVGAPGSDTPEGNYKVGELVPEPPWFRPGEPMIPYGDPGNELGTRWVGWIEEDGSATSYGFHGTWEPQSIGQAVSDGCVRLRNEDVEELYKVIPRGTSILVRM